MLLEISLLSWKGVHSILETEKICSIVCVFDSIVVKILDIKLTKIVPTIVQSGQYP